MIKCSLCGLQFTEEEAHSSCSKCSFFKGCKLIKCPNCGFELALEPKRKNRRKQ